MKHLIGILYFSLWTICHKLKDAMFNHYGVTSHPHTHTHPHSIRPFPNNNIIFVRNFTINFYSPHTPHHQNNFASIYYMYETNLKEKKKKITKLLWISPPLVVVASRPSQCEMSMKLFIWRGGEKGKTCKRVRKKTDKSLTTITHIRGIWDIYYTLEKSYHYIYSKICLLHFCNLSSLFNHFPHPFLQIISFIYVLSSFHFLFWPTKNKNLHLSLSLSRKWRGMVHTLSFY